MVNNDLGSLSSIKVVISLNTKYASENQLKESDWYLNWAEYEFNLNCTLTVYAISTFKETCKQYKIKRLQFAIIHEKHEQQGRVYIYAILEYIYNKGDVHCDPTRTTIIHNKSQTF